MLKRTRPISPPLRSSIPFESDINISPLYCDYTIGSEAKRPRISATPTPDNAPVMGVHEMPGHSHGYHMTSSSSKRRRASPEAMDDDDDYYMATNHHPTRDSKRRRTVAPSLDGKSRGWFPSSSSSTQSSSRSSRCFEDDEEDFDGDTEEGTHDDCHSSRGEDWKADMGDYRDANTLLHALHQNRLRIQPGIHCYHPHPQQPPSPFIAGDNVVSQDRIDPGIVEILDTESQSVRKRYEEHNKLLGSLFLSRRRDLSEMISIPS